MSTLEALGVKVRTKNAGPFWITADLFCGNAERFGLISTHLDTTTVARILGASAIAIKRFDMPELNVVKLSVPRPVTQGARHDRDMHGAQWAHLLSQYVIDPKRGV